MIYAPVAIPTLCRFEHFKACIESLSRCTWAEHTEVFVGLDYPAKESHWEGYLKIKDYLDQAGDMGFKKLHVIKRNHNYGLDYVKRDPNQIGNAAALVKEIAQSFSCYIYSEDDNVFSPNFLEYIDKGLEKFKDDDKVVAVVGYCHPYAFKHADNNYFYHQTDFSAWGYGTWFEKQQRMSAEIKDGFLHHTFSLKNMLKVKRCGLNRFEDYIDFSMNCHVDYIIDATWSVYQRVTDRYVVVPTLSKVRNIGWDRSGNSTSGMKMKKRNIMKAERHMHQPIDTALHFDYVGTGDAFMDYNNRQAALESDGRIGIVLFVKYLVVNVTSHYLPGLLKLYMRVRGK